MVPRYEGPPAGGKRVGVYSLVKANLHLCKDYL